MEGQQYLAGFGPILDCNNPKKIRIVMSRSFLKKNFFFVIERTEQLKSKITVDRSNWLPKPFLITLSSFFTRKIYVVLTFRNISFLNIQWLIELFFSYFGQLVD